jgi:hypothetical protein
LGMVNAPWTVDFTDDVGAWGRWHSIDEV